MKKEIWTYIVSGILSVVAVVGLLLLLLLPNGNSTPFEPVNLYVEDVTLEIGQIKTDFYQVSAEDYEISFELDKDNVIEIDENKIVAINSGKVKVDVRVIVEGNSIEESFYVTVLAESYSYQLENLINCSVNGNNIVFSSQTAQFKIRCFDKDGIEIKNPAIEMIASDGINASFEFGMVRITATKNGTITFAIAQTDIEFTMNIILN